MFFSKHIVEFYLEYVLCFNVKSTILNLTLNRFFVDSVLNNFVYSGQI